MAADVTNQLQVQALVRAIAANEARVDILVNGAGATLPSAETMQSQKAFDATIEVNLSAAYRCITEHLPLLERSGNASIVNVASIGGLRGFPGNPGYVASKGGLRLLTKALAVDLAGKGIRVNTLIPGYIVTDMTMASFEDEAARARRSAHTLLGRWGQVDDLIGGAIFLASSASGYMTGAELVIDGGWTANGLIKQ
jgi:gluconate 5-dehydrogenase